jgi:CelD/BcsL family acetyltransferase involved in cellulose biosynthesis
VRSLSVQCVDSSAALAALEPEWLELERSSGNTLPFRTFDWVSSWWGHLREHRLAVHDSLAFRTVRTPAGRLVGVAPFMLTERPAAGPFRVRCLQFIGADPNITEIRGPLCDPHLEPDVVAAVNADLASVDVDWIRWSGLAREQSDYEALAEGNAEWREGVSCFVLPLPSSWDELRSSRPKNLRESLRKCYASLRRDHLDVSLETVTTPADVPGALDDFFRMHAARAALDGTVRHANVFREDECQAFLGDVCVRFARRGALRVFRLRVGGDLVATRIAFLVGGGIYFYYSGYDPSYAKYGVATTLVAEALKHAISEGVRAANFSTGRDPSKLRWRPEELQYREAFAIASRDLSRIKFDAVRAAGQSMASWSGGRYARLLLSRRSPRLADWVAEALPSSLRLGALRVGGRQRSLP